MSDIIAYSNILTNYFKNTDFILHAQNISLFFISLYSLFSFINYNLQEVNDDKSELIKPFDALMPIVGTHSIIDLFLTNTNDIRIHHIIILFIIFYNYYNDVKPEDRFLISYPLLKTEISSIFYVLKYWLSKNSSFYTINSLIFYGCFLKFRIIDFYYEVINNNYTLNIIFNKYSGSSSLMSYMLSFSCYGLYLLNIYWFMIINKILFKSISKIININKESICHYLCAYLHCINIPLSIYLYSYNKDEKNILDVTGIMILSTTSYLYHSDIYNKLYKKTIDTYIAPDKHNIILFFNDNISIHLRSFLTIATNYYYTPYFFDCLSISGLLHLLSIYNIVILLFDLLIHNNNKEQFLLLNNIMVCFPIAFDVLLVYFNSTSEIGIPFLWVNLIIIMLIIINPFYHLTHVAVHIGLIYHNYYLCLSHRYIIG